jgi:hypothetical protein
LKDEEAIDWCKRISTLSLDKGNKLKECHGGLPKEKVFSGMEEEKRRRRKCEEFLLVLMCARIKHGGNVCKNQA